MTDTSRQYDEEAPGAPESGETLDDFLATHPPEGVAPEPPDGEDSQVPDIDEGQAAWAMARLAQIRRKQAEHDATAALQHKAIDDWIEANGVHDRRARIDGWLVEVNAALEANAGYFEGLLLAYHERLYDDAVARGVSDRNMPKTIKLPDGKLTARKSGGSTEIQDQEAAMAALVLWWENEVIDLLDHRPRLMVSLINDAVKAGTLRLVDGEFVLLDGPDGEPVVEGEGEDAEVVVIPGIRKTGAGVTFDIVVEP